MAETRRVVVVEPDEAIRRELEELLAPLGHSDWVIGIPITPEVRVAGDPSSCIVAESASMREALSRVRRVAAARSTVLVTGETGTGKDVIAGLLHQLSPRASGPFVKVSCAALPETLLESELFGHERGAFTGADHSRVGRFEQASEGTLFLDEIGEMSLATQVKLLRVVEEREFHRLGSVDTRRTGARIVLTHHIPAIPSR